VAEKDGCIFIDLANDGWEVVRISPDGWEIIKDAPVYFLRPRGMENRYPDQLKAETCKN
jgi:hypothetical protein